MATDKQTAQPISRQPSSGTTSVSHTSHREATPISPTSLTPDRLYQALYPYDGQEAGDLTFKAGDIIQVNDILHFMYMYMCEESWCAIKDL